jgi:hypothetical protein
VGPTTGTPFVIPGPFNRIYTSSNRNVAGVNSIGPSATNQIGVVGNVLNSYPSSACEEGKYLGQISMTNTFSSIGGVNCKRPATPVVAPLPVSDTYTCPPGGIISGFRTNIDDGALVGSQFYCDNNSGFPWNGKRPFMGEETGYEKNETGYSTLVGTHLGPYISSSAQPCPAGSVYSNVTVSGDKVTPGGCVPYGTSNFLQTFACAPDQYIKSYKLSPGKIGAGIQFVCSDGAMSNKLGSTSSGEIASATTDSGFTTMNAIYNPRLASLGDIANATAPFSCPEGQRVSGATIQGDADGVTSLSFKCSPFPSISLPQPTYTTTPAPPTQTATLPQITPTVSVPITPTQQPAVIPKPPPYVSVVNQRPPAQIPPVAIPVEAQVSDPPGLFHSPMFVIFIVLLLLVCVGYYVYRKRQETPSTIH